ncbi:hypothetical protein J3R30DRAFT_3709865 [Lentinula aciculospora]|uniref:CFEM domain-containing protein n=1 Tax=Lentinula aciculospora TaxID=153920 RepID=A0A9W9A1Z1_9AGAR|nr:hypothetical protein J3R30DRAFT_3725288 [Lentinula aciculospora]KAJ4471433.1 hypothetical protein J3R30DRAFT_3709865 [Lentinula aciculospora]
MVAAQSSSTSSSSSSATASSSAVSSASSAASTTGSGSGSLSASSTSSAALPSLSGYDTCVVTCFETAIAQANCSSVVPESCYCNSTDYQSGLISCMQSNCAGELATAEGLTNQFCALASPSTSISFSITSLPSSSSSSSSALSSGSSSASLTSVSSGTSASSTGSSPSSSNAASGTVFGGFSRVALPSTVVAVIGVLTGALLA